jgi:hypothetical protein
MSTSSVQENLVLKYEKEVARLQMCMQPILVCKCFLGWDMQIIHDS